MRLPDLTFDLPDWDEADFTKIKEAKEKIKDIGKKAGRSSDNFKKAFQILHNLVKQGCGEELAKKINNNVDVRALTLLLSSEVFASNASLTRAHLQSLTAPRNPMSKLSLMQLIRAYFVNYDTIASPEILTIWGELISSQLKQLRLSGAPSDFSSYAKHRSMLFCVSGPSKVVAFAKDKQSDLDGVLQDLGLKGFPDSRFLTLCRYQYYLEDLKTAPVGADLEILNEIVKKEVAHAPLDSSRLFGHAILEILIDRSAGSPISSAWQSAILAIAGDPRVPTSNQNYQKWWVLLGTERINLMRGWLSRFDLALFLKVLEQSARDECNADMQRMFESRKHFMEGLLEQKIVSQSRLFLSKSAETYLKKYYNQEQLPKYARVDSKDTSMIYLNLSGKVHMIEGSHSFKLKLLDKLPSKSKLVDFSVAKFEDYALRTGIVKQYEQETQQIHGLKELTHDVHLNWQHNAINFLAQQGISVSVHALIGKDRYREYKSKFGV